MADTGAVALRFDIVADASQFNSAVATAKGQWAAATESMAQSGRGIGDGIMSIAGAMAAQFQSVAQFITTALEGGATGVEKGVVAAFEKAKQAGESWLDSFTALAEKYGGRIAQRLSKFVTDAIKPLLGEALEFSATKLGEALDKSKAGDKFVEIANAAGRGVTSLTDKFRAMGLSAVEAWRNSSSAVEGFKASLTAAWTGLLSQPKEQAEEAEAAMSSLGEKAKGWVDGVKHGLAVFAGKALPSEQFDAIVEALDKQIAAHERNIELIGKTAGEVAKLRAEWQAMDNLGGDAERMSAEQKARLDAKIAEVGAVGARADAAREAESQAKSYKQIVDHLERQIELQTANSETMRMTVGEAQELRAIRDAEWRMASRGRDLSEAELNAVREKAALLRESVNAAARAGLERRGETNFERMAEQARVEAETLGMSAGAAAAYKAELAEIARWKEANLPLTDQFRERLHAWAAEAGRAMDQTAKLRESFETFKQAGQAVSSALEGAFSKFMSGTKFHWKEFIDDLLKDLARLILRTQVLQPLFGGGASGGGLFASLFGSLFGAGGGGWQTTVIPARASGGPVAAGMPYMVGERGPELFVPSQSGEIAPNAALGGRTVTMNMTIDLTGANGDETIARISAQAARAAAIRAVQETNDAFPMRNRQLQLLGT